MRIVDCFTFYNELDLLKYRLTILNGVVDTFVLVEANLTHKGCEKSMIFQEHQDLFAEFKDKIVYVPVTDMPCPESAFESKEDAWKNEKHQRNCIRRGLDTLELRDEDVILISDLDEIPNPILLASVKRGEVPIRLQKLQQDMYYYNLNTCFLEKWYHAKIVTWAMLKELECPIEDIRFKECKAIPKGGWHLSYFGDVQQIQNKIMNFAHQEFNTETFTDPKHIREAVSKGVCLYDREIPIARIPVGRNANLPPRAKTLLAKFIRF